MSSSPEHKLTLLCLFLFFFQKKVQKLKDILSFFTHDKKYNTVTFEKVKPDFFFLYYMCIYVLHVIKVINLT